MMGILFRKYMKTASLMLAVFSFSILLGQEKAGRSAEAIFHKYHKIGITTGMSILYVTNQENAMEYKYLNQKAFNLGLTYNFYQAGNFNFKVSTLWRIYSIKSTQRLKKEDTNLPLDVAGTLTVGDYEQFLVPVMAEYFWAIGKKLSVSFSLGPEFTIYPEDPGSGASFFVTKNGTEIGYTDKGDSKDGWLYIGVNVSLGLNIETGPLLLRPTFTFHYQPETLYTNVVTTQNLLVSENTVSKHEITGNYVMFGISILPSRDLFRSKKQK